MITITWRILCIPTDGYDEDEDDGAGFDDVWCGLALHAATTTRHTTRSEHRLTAPASHAHRGEHRRMQSSDGFVGTGHGPGRYRTLRVDGTSSYGETRCGLSVLR